MPGWILMSTLALAGSSGFYHPDDVAATSEAFSRAGAAAEQYATLDARAAGVATALRQWETALDLLGERAPAAEAEHLAGVRERYQREHAVLQAFVDTMVADFDSEFVAALDRALAAHPGEEQICRAQVPVGKPLPGIRVRLQDNPDCEGENLNVSLAASMDADPALTAAIDEILALQWPSLTVPSEPRPAIGAGDRAVSVLDLFDAVASSRLRGIDAADASARLPFEAALEQGANKEELSAMLQEARAVTEATAAARRDLGAPVLAAAEKVLAKWQKKGEETTAWCATPSALGGCTATDATDTLVPRLSAHKKVIKAAR